MNRLPLPIDEILPEVMRLAERGESFVLRAPPGAGKTTRVPPAIWNSLRDKERQVMVLQPRRIAARATAARMASELGCALGTLVGFQTRFEKAHSAETRILVVTEGILTRKLLDDPFLERVGAVVFDEFHERNLQSDLALAMVRQSQRLVRNDLLISVMSATLDPAPVSAYLGGAPSLECSGKVFPVAIEYSPLVDRRPLPDSVATAIESAIGRTPGDVLVFLPGVGEIRSCQKKIGPLANDLGLEVHLLFGELSADEQDRALRPSSRRKVILATNVAETSLTIEGVTCVIDSGLARVARLDSETGLDRLDVMPISKASAEQRAGRAGRLQAGLCVRLWPEAAHRARTEFETPEIRRVDLTGALLQILSWIEPDLNQFPWYEAPDPSRLEQALAVLERLDAMNCPRADEPSRSMEGWRGASISEVGRSMNEIPAAPRLARVLMEGVRLGVLNDAALAVAILSERDPFERTPQGVRRQASVSALSDLAEKVAAIRRYESHGDVDSPCGRLRPHATQVIMRSASQLERIATRMKVHAKSTSQDKTTREHDLCRAILAGFSDRVAVRREKGKPRGLLVGGRGVTLAAESLVLEPELFVCLQLEDSGKDALVRCASGVLRDWLPEAYWSEEVTNAFDQENERLVARRVLRWDGLPLEEAPCPVPMNEDSKAMLAQAAMDSIEKVLPLEGPVRRYLARLRFLAKNVPELAIPSFGSEELAAVIRDLSEGAKSFADLRSRPWIDAIRGRLTPDQIRAVEKDSPEKLQVPSGSMIAIEYPEEGLPILAVRIQELFGMRETPRLARGRVPVLLHLLAPNYRPHQVTSDLASFWKNTYAVVRKELRARYPKHAWPEDPYTAVAESRPKRKS